MKISTWIEKNTSSLAGKRIAITGATGDLGRVWCEYLAKLGATLILLDRNKDKSAALHSHLQRICPGVQVHRIGVDLAQMEAVREATEALRQLEPDVFIHNAGAYNIPRHVCSTGYNSVFQINFVSAYYMIRELLPDLDRRGGRVVVVGSIAHNYSSTDSADTDFSGRSASSKVYGNAKRYLMFSLYELFRNHRGADLSVVHPGITFTNITAHYPPLIFAVIKHPMKVIFMRPQRACLSLLAGVFTPCEYHTWIGPRFFDIWGLPKKRRLNSCSPEESALIGERAERIYNKLKNL